MKTLKERIELLLSDYIAGCISASAIIDILGVQDNNKKNNIIYVLRNYYLSWIESNENNIDAITKDYVEHIYQLIN